MYGITTCMICNQLLKEIDEIGATTHFLEPGDRLYEYSDGAFHLACFETWKYRAKFEAKYAEYEAKRLAERAKRPH